MHWRLSAFGRVIGPVVLVLGLAVAVTQFARGIGSASEPDSVRPVAAPDHTHTDIGDAVAEYERGVAAAYAGALAQAQAETYWQTVNAANQAATAGSRGGGTRQSRCADAMACIRDCESHGNYGAVSSGGTYRGAYQFSQTAWESVGGTGDPAAAPPAEQDARAAQLYSSSGSSPWPNCG